MKIETRDTNGKPNGYVVPIWNALENHYRPDQVYLTAVLPGCQKGPHLHKKRGGMFCCVRGNALIVVRCPKTGNYGEMFTGEDHDYNKVCVPPGYAAAIYNPGPETALILNMPSPAWSKDDPDEWPVEDWSYETTTA